MSMKTKIAILIPSAVVLLFTIVGGLEAVRAANNSEGAYRQLQVYSEVLARVRSEYVEDPNLPVVTDGALHGLLESLDPNSSFLTANEYKEYKAHLKGDAKADIGAVISKRFGYASVVTVIPGGPADKASLQPADIIEAIEGKTTREMSLAEIHNRLQGEVGSNVSVSIVRARRAEPQKVTITRDMVNIPPVSDKMIEDIGYIQIDGFPKGKSQEIANKVKNLQKSGAKRLIVDLRNCAEGEESEGIATANLFMNHGTITYLEGQKYPREAFNADPSKAITTLPMVVLVNKSTAGPAELVAAAILDNARGDVVGDKTFGDGSVQKVIELSDGSAVILSVAKYYSPRGKTIQDNAVTPNVVVADANDDANLPDDDDNATSQEEEKVKPVQQQDEQLQKAIQVLKRHAA
jgi:carboxyl-terminal processing protease